MSIKFVIFIIVFVYYLTQRGSKDKIGASKKLAKLAFVLLLLYSGLRHVSVGPDTYGYYGFFMNSANSSWEVAFSGFSVSAQEIRDPLFPVIEKAFSSIIPSWQLYLLSLALLYYYAMYKLWVRYVSSPEGILLATVLVLSLFGIIALSGIRQQLTMAISMFLIPYVEDRRWKMVIPVVLIGSLIHISFLFFLAFIPLQSINRNNYKALIGISIVLIPVIALLAGSIVGSLAGMLQNDYYMTYAQSDSQEKPYVYIALCTLISIFLFMNYGKLASAPRFFSSALILMTITFPLIIQDGTLIRVGQYFTIYMMLSLPYVLDRHINKGLFYTGMILVLVLSIYINPGVYHFFWENLPDYNFSPFGLK